MMILGTIFRLKRVWGKGIRYLQFYAILIGRAKDAGHVGGLIPHLVEGGVSVLQYVDDTIIFMEHGLHKSLNMELILSIFEQLCGLKITFHKSEVFCMDQAKEIVDQYRTVKYFAWIKLKK
jgi:hypothetical protein